MTAPSANGGEPSTDVEHFLMPGCELSTGKTQADGMDADGKPGVSRLTVISTVLIVASVLMEAVSAMKRAGIDVDLQREPAVSRRRWLDALAVIDVGGQKTTFAVEVQRRAPYPNEIPRLDSVRAEIAEFGEPMLVADFITESVGQLLQEAGWSWLDRDGNMELRAPGLMVSRRETATPTRSRTRERLPGGQGSAALIRLLIGWPRGTPLPPATELAKRIGVTQPRVSQVLGSLERADLTTKSQGAWRVVDRGRLLDRYIADEVEPSRSTTFLYSLETPRQVAERASALDAGVLVSADVGPDVVAPWKQPAAVVLYATSPVSASELNAVEAESFGSANVHLRYADAATVAPWPKLVAPERVDGLDVELVDPALMMRDLLELGGGDREEAAGVLREWIVGRQ